MLNSRIYLLQFLGIFMLLCGYLVGNQPDRLSVMHISPNPARHAVFTKSTRTTSKRNHTQTSDHHHHNNHTRKTNVPTNVSFYLAQPIVHEFRYFPEKRPDHTPATGGYYRYMYYKEINPPPPRSC